MCETKGVEQMSIKSMIIKKVAADYLLPGWARKRRTHRTRNSLLWSAAGIGALMAARAVLKKNLEFDLRGRTVLITGGSRGLGLVLAREFLREGSRVVVCARGEDDLDRAYEDLLQYGSQVLTVPC